MSIASLIIFASTLTAIVKTEKTSVTEIKTIISRFLPEAEVILFGSRARGDNKYLSDYDLLVITKSAVDNQQRLYFQALLRKKLADNHILADVIVQSEKDVERKKELPGHIIRAAMLEGIHV